MSKPKPVPVKRKQGAKEYRTQALRRLTQRFGKENEGQTLDLDGEVTITPLLKSAEGGIPRILEALRAHDNDDAKDFMEFYDSLSGKDRRYLTLEEISVGAGLDAIRLWEIASSALLLHGQNQAKVILASSIPSIVQKSVRMAKTSRGLADREMMLKAGGVLPVPKGAQIAIQTNVTTEKAETETREIPAYLDAGQRLRQIHEAVEQRQLPSPPREPLPVGGHIDRLQQESVEALRGE